MTTRHDEYEAKIKPTWDEYQAKVKALREEYQAKAMAIYTLKAPNAK